MIRIRVVSPGQLHFDGDIMDLVEILVNLPRPRPTEFSVEVTRDGMTWAEFRKENK